MNNFFDSNVLLYLVEMGSKSVRAQELVDAGGVISVQVLNEFVDVCRRKHKMAFTEIVIALTPIRDAMRVVDLTLASHELAFQIATSSKIRIYDANIVAAAELAGCDILYTEDLNHGQRIGGVSIQNPFIIA